MYYYLVVWKLIWYSRCTKLTNAQFISFCASFLGNWFADGGGGLWWWWGPSEVVPQAVLLAPFLPPPCRQTNQTAKSITLQLKKLPNKPKLPEKSIAKGTTDPRQWVFWLIQHLSFKQKLQQVLKSGSNSKLILFGKGREFHFDKSMY